MRVKIDRKPYWKLILVFVPLILWCCSFHVPEVRCDEPEGHIKKDPIFDQYNIYDTDGNKQGYIKKDPIFDYFNVYDKGGKRTGRIKKDVIVPDTYQYDRK